MGRETEIGANKRAAALCLLRDRADRVVFVGKKSSESEATEPDSILEAAFAAGAKRQEWR